MKQKKKNIPKKEINIREIELLKRIKSLEGLLIDSKCVEIEAHYILINGAYRLLQTDPEECKKYCEAYLISIQGPEYKETKKI
jgi:hypothetical protein